jgi:hypothetical protein
MGRFCHEEQSTPYQNDVAPGNADTKDGKQGIGQLHQPSQAEQHRHPKDEGERKANLSRTLRLRCRTA